MNIKKQRGSITLLGALGIFTAIGGMYSVLELGDKMIKKAQFNAHAEAIAPVAMRSEIALTQAMVQNGEVDKPYELSHAFLQQLGLTKNDVTLKLTFGNITHLEQPETVTNGQGQSIQIHEKFIPLEAHADNPKKGLNAGEMPPKFNAVAVQIKATPSGIFTNFIPEGRAIYGLSDDQEHSPEIGSCFCDARFNACMAADKSNNVMGEANSNDRRQYCETGIAPSVGGGLIGMFFGGKPKYPSVNSVKFSPQWVGRPYDGEEGGASTTDETSQAWLDVMADKPLTVSNGNNPFPEAGWKSSEAKWWPGDHDMKFTGIENKKTFFGIVGVPKVNAPVDGTFYVGRSGVCAYPSSGFFFFRMMDLAHDFMLGNKDCLRYSANPSVKYNFAKILSPFMNLINGFTGANQHYYSCRDFSGIDSARSGLLQLIRRTWTNPLQDWTKSYQQSDCSVKQMHFHGFWIFGHWE